MGVYIKGMGIISPQKTFDSTIFTSGILPFSGNRLTCVEPNYSDFIDAKQIRRMSRVIKMGVASSFNALKDGNIETPDAVIVGTAYGCLEDTNSFLKKMIENKEDMLNPTPFIHSTHNTIASQIALLFKCHGYNSTYVHRNISFESALMDAVLLISENAVNNVLVGGIDELTDTSFSILNRLGNYKQAEDVNHKNLYTLNSRGSVAGEGAAFFALANKLDPTCYCEVRVVQVFSFNTADYVVSKVKTILADNKIEEIDVLISGNNGDVEAEKVFDSVSGALNVQKNTLKYKHFCGEYPTSNAFAMWMGAEILKEKNVPAAFECNIQNKKIRNVLIYNQNKNLHHSLILLSAC